MTRVSCTTEVCRTVVVVGVLSFFVLLCRCCCFEINVPPVLKCRRTQPASTLRSFTAAGIVIRHRGYSAVLLQYFLVRRLALARNEAPCCLCSDARRTLSPPLCISNCCTGKRTRDGAVPVEIRLAVALRMLAGASYIDLALLFGISKETVFHILWQVVDAINNTPEVGPFFFPQTVDECTRQAALWEVQ